MKENISLLSSSQKNKNNVDYYCFPKHKKMSSTVWNCLKLKDFQFVVLKIEETRKYLYFRIRSENFDFIFYLSN